MVKILFILFVNLVLWEKAISQEKISVTIIGDSLTVGSSDYIKYYLPDAVIDAQVGRKFQEAMERIKVLEYQGLLKDIVVIALGTNGVFNIEEGLEVIDYLSNRNKKVIFINTKVPRWWEEEVNGTYEILKKLRPQIEVIDWKSISEVVCNRSDIPECFRKDGYHLTQVGSYIYSFIIYKYVKKFIDYNG